MIELIGEADWLTAAVSGLVGLVSVVVTNMIAWARFRRAHLLDDRTEAILRRMLRDRRFKRRKFETIQGFVPLSDDKLRETLLRAGAVRLMGTDNVEYWGLLENHTDRVFPSGPR